MSDKPTNDACAPTPTTLRDEDIVTEEPSGRRSMLGLIGASVLGALSVALGGWTNAQPASKVHPTPGGPALTDRDAGPSADPAGHGRGGVQATGPQPQPQPQPQQTGVTDSDAGANADPVGRGRRP